MLAGWEVLTHQGPEGGVLLVPVATSALLPCCQLASCCCCCCAAQEQRKESKQQRQGALHQAAGKAGKTQARARNLPLFTGLHTLHQNI